MNYDDCFRKLSESKFRSRFHLSEKDKNYIEKVGLDAIRDHAKTFIATRLAPAVIPNDGKQTPMRGHPVFLAQHACACCCRDCLFKWYRVPKGVPLSPEQQEKIVRLLLSWIERELES
ncbi:MAG: DUF4186 domain-containing protein [Clostridia bacterium]|nr:DUF4186 domain-containing protein [Clostridia bacterium]